MFKCECRATGFTVPLAHGKGFFYGPIGLLPFKAPVNIVVGEPIPLEHFNGMYMNMLPLQHSVAYM